MQDFRFRQIPSTDEGTGELASSLPSGDNELRGSLPYRIF